MANNGLSDLGLARAMNSCYMTTQKHRIKNGDELTFLIANGSPSLRSPPFGPLLRITCFVDFIVEIHDRNVVISKISFIFILRLLELFRKRL